MRKNKEDVKIIITPVFECKHYDREEINIVLDGITPPVLKCNQCGGIFQNMQEIEKDRRKMWRKVEKGK